MNRQIKVIAFDVESKQQTNTGFYLDITGKILSNHENIKVVEFTGLTDHHKNEVYEGHVLQNIKDNVLLNWLVCFKNGCFGIVNIGIDGYLNMDAFYPVNSTYYFQDREIIGHMYTNPELLKGKN